MAVACDTTNEEMFILYWQLPRMGFFFVSDALNISEFNLEERWAY